MLAPGEEKKNPFVEQEGCAWGGPPRNSKYAADQTFFHVLHDVSIERRYGELEGGIQRQASLPFCSYTLGCCQWFYGSKGPLRGTLSSDLVGRFVGRYFD